MKEDYNADFEFISAYFHLELSDEEILLFEQRMKDTSFARKVSIYKESIEIVNEVDPNSEENVRKREWLKLIKGDYKSRSIIRLKKNIGIAASLIIAVSLISYFVFSNTNSTTQIEKAWNKNVGLDFVLRSTIDSVTLSVSEALFEYEKKDYKEALNILKKYDAASHPYSDILTLRALANYKLKNSVKAFKYLDTLNSYRPEVSQWYRGLIYLENDEVEKAKLYLNIPDDSEKEITLKK